MPGGGSGDFAVFILTSQCPDYTPWILFQVTSLKFILHDPVTGFNRRKVK
jgi:hypothetical protein